MLLGKKNSLKSELFTEQACRDVITFRTLLHLGPFITFRTVYYI